MKHSVGRREMRSVSQFSTYFTDTVNKGTSVKTEHCQKIILFYESLLAEDVFMFTSGRTFGIYIY